MILQRDGSKLLENCISQLNPQFQEEKILQIMDAVVNLPPLRTVESGFVFFSDALTNKFGNYVIQRAFEKSNQA